MALRRKSIIALEDNNNCELYRKSVSGVDSLISKGASVIPAGAAILNSYSYFVENTQQPPFLFDTGFNVHITPKKDFEPGTLVKLYSRSPKIMTDGGPVYATSMGLSVKWLTGSKGEKVPIRMARCLYIKGSSVKIVSGEC
jgi:hypothetical protein